MKKAKLEAETEIDPGRRRYESCRYCRLVCPTSICLSETLKRIRSAGKDWNVEWT